MTRRLFIGIDLPAELKARIGESMERERVAHGRRGIRWVPASKLHLTLKFLGEIPEERAAALIPGIVTAMGEAVSEVPASELKVGGAGVFPQARHPRVLWIEARDPAGWLARLAARLEEALAPLGFVREQRPFVAHLTVARLERPLPPGLLDRWARAEAGVFVPAALTLFESRQPPQGDYIALGSVGLLPSAARRAAMG
jgi:2'-5' RNA ligase